MALIQQKVNLVGWEGWVRCMGVKVGGLVRKIGCITAAHHNCSVNVTSEETWVWIWVGGLCKCSSVCVIILNPTTHLPAALLPAYTVDLFPLCRSSQQTKPSFTQLAPSKPLCVHLFTFHLHWYTAEFLFLHHIPLKYYIQYFTKKKSTLKKKFTFKLCISQNDGCRYS